jgi:hypothetical protein
MNLRKKLWYEQILLASSKELISSLIINEKNDKLNNWNDFSLNLN